MKGIKMLLAFSTSSLSSFFLLCFVVPFIFGVQKAFGRVLVGASKTDRTSLLLLMETIRCRDHLVPPPREKVFIKKHT
jgi:hypothetical protein